MWIADGWKDYKVIDCSKGEKLERWGDYTLVRPDPQVIWDTPRKHRGWKRMNAHYHRSPRGGGEWEFFDLPQQWSIRYKELTFHLKPFRFKHTGLFPELGLVWGAHPHSRAADPGTESLCLHGRGHSGRCQSRGCCDPCGRLKGHGFLGEGKCRSLRA